MSDILDSVNAFEKLLDIEYDIVIARKGVSVNLHIVFHKNHFFHLAGIHYLTDVQYLRGDREILFDKIKKSEIDSSKIEKSKLYKNIENRVKLLKNLESYFDSNDMIFKYNDTLNTFSLVKADYLLEHTENNSKVFTFLSKNPDENYFCRSFFPQEKQDYSFGQTKWILLFKKKIHKSTKQEEILFCHKNYKLSKKC